MLAPDKTDAQRLAEVGLASGKNILMLLRSLVRRKKRSRARIFLQCGKGFQKYLRILCLGERGRKWRISFINRLVVTQASGHRKGRKSTQTRIA
jgi:hypothetical protein